MRLFGKKRILSLREQALMLFAVLAAVGVLYAIARYRPEQWALQQLEAETKQLASTLEKKRVPRPLNRDAAHISGELEKVEGQLSGRREQLKGLEARFVDAASTQALQDLMVDISTLARTSGVTIRETLPFESESGSGARASASGLPENMATRFKTGGFLRPLKRLRLEGNYPSLRRFIEGSAELTRQVVVLQFGFTTMSSPSPAGGSANLNAEIVVAL